MGLRPDMKILQTTHASPLRGLDNKVRNLMDTNEYKQIFENVIISRLKSAGRWETNHGGEYFAVLAEPSQVEALTSY